MRYDDEYVETIRKLMKIILLTVQTAILFYLGDLTPITPILSIITMLEEYFNSLALRLVFQFFHFSSC